MQCQQLVDVAESVINNSQPLVEDHGHVRAAVEVQAYRVSPKVVGASQSVWHIRGDGTVVGEGCLPCGAGHISPCSLCAGTRPLRRRTRIFVANQRSVHLHSTTIPAVTARVTTPTRHTGRRAGMHASLSQALAQRCLEAVCIASSSSCQATISKRNMHDAPAFSLDH
jgi:hypothetical protein